MFLSQWLLLFAHQKTSLHPYAGIIRIKSEGLISALKYRGTP